MTLLTEPTVERATLQELSTLEPLAAPLGRIPAFTTRAVRAAVAADKEHGAVMPPLHLSATFAFEAFATPRTYDYTRSGNPTRSHLAGIIADLEGGAGAVVTSSGMSAVALVLQTLVKPGDVVIAAHDCYGGTQRLLRSLAARGHFEVVFTDLSLGYGDWCNSTRAPRLVWVETPSNPLLRITDIRAVCEGAHSAGSLVVVDNTFLSPALQRPMSSARMSWCIRQRSI